MVFLLMCRVVIVLAIFPVALQWVPRQASQMSQCYDLTPNQFITTLKENTRKDTAIFEFSINMEDITLSLTPATPSEIEGFLRLETGAISNKIILNETLTINGLNPDLRGPPPPDTEEEIDCGNDDAKYITPFNVKTSLRYILRCQYRDNQPVLENVYVNVQEVNDFAPSFLCPPYSKHISEFTPIGSTVFILRGLAWDPDVEGGIDGYGLQDDGSGMFSIPRFGDGAVVLESELDYEQAQQYTLNLTAYDFSQDNDNPSRYNWTDLFLNIIDEDDQNPAFTHRWHHLKIQEMNVSLIGASFPTLPLVHAYDQDLGRNDTVAYEMISGHAFDGVAYFDIHNSSGLITVKHLLDREKISQYWLEIKVNNPLKRNAFSFVNITIEDINDNPPVMERDFYSLLIAENSPEGMFVLQLRAFDQDEGENAEHAFVLEDPLGAFEIDPESGRVTVKSSNPLNREIRATITIFVYAKETKTDEKYMSNRTEVLIQLRDVNDNNPIFTEDGAYLFVVSTHVTEGTPVGMVRSSDADEGVNGDVLFDVYVPLSDHQVAMDYYVDSQTGIIFAARDLDKPDGSLSKLAIIGHDQALVHSERRLAVAAVTLVFSSGTVPPWTTPLPSSSVTPTTPSAITQTTTGNGFTESCTCPTLQPTKDTAVGFSVQTFGIAVGLLAALLVTLLLLLLICFVRGRPKAEQVDKCTEAEFDGPITDTASLVANEHLRHSMAKAFKQLEGETSTERVLGMSRGTIEVRQNDERPPLLQWPVHDLEPCVVTEFQNLVNPPISTQTPKRVPYERLDPVEGYLVRQEVDNLSVSINVDTAEPIYSISSAKRNMLTLFPTQVKAMSLEKDSDAETSEQDFSGWKSEEETSITTDIIREDSDTSHTNSSQSSAAKLIEIAENNTEEDQLSGVMLLDSVIEEEERRSALGSSFRNFEELDESNNVLNPIVNIEQEQVHVVGELPRPFRKEDEDYYVDHTFYTRIGPITIL